MPIHAFFASPILAQSNFATNMTTFHVSLVGRKDLSGEIYRQIRRAVLDRRLRPGDPLPLAANWRGRLPYHVLP